MFINKHCNICLKPKKVLFNIAELDVNNISYFTKLKYTVPEIVWSQNHHICFICVEQLNTTYGFKKLCAQSFGVVLPESVYLAVDDNLQTQGNLIFESKLEVTEEPPRTSDFPNTKNVYTVEAKLTPFSDQNVKEVVEVETSEVFDDLGNDLNDDDDDDDDDDYAPSPVYEKLPKSKNREKRHMCDICDKAFTTLSSLKSHSMSVHTDRSKWNNNCYVCDKVFARKSTLVAHLKSKHLEKGNFSCFHCNQEFNVKHLLVIHIKEHHSKVEDTEDKPKRSFDCDVCNQVFSVRNHLFEHALREHGRNKNEIKPYKCDICNKRFKVSTYLVSHKLYHEGNRTKICNVCGKGFITLKDLKIHETYHSNDFTYCCPECGQTFKNHKLLYAHKISKHVPPEQWKFCCSICGKRFPRVSGYKMHMQRHMGDKRFLCHLCDKKFVSKFQLLRHVESHSNVKKFHCDLCGKDYREKRIFNIHLLDVHGIGDTNGEKKLCHICSMSFSCNYKLRRHILKHSKPYGCSLCEKRYPDNYHLKQHLQRKHKILEAAAKTDLELKDEDKIITNL